MSDPYLVLAVADQLLKSSRDQNYGFVSAPEFGGADEVLPVIRAHARRGADLLRLDLQLIEIEISNTVHGTHLVTDEMQIPDLDSEKYPVVIIKLEAPKHYFTQSHPNNGFTLETEIAGKACRLLRDLFTERGQHPARYHVIATAV